MTGPIIYIALIVVIVAFPAHVGWKLARKKGQMARMAGTLLAGQIILTPGIGFIAFSGDRAGDENPIRTLIIYGAMALMISMMTFVILEIKQTRSDR